jgi:hypothetical protein
MEVSGQLHAAAALSPGGIVPGTHWVGGWVGPPKRWAMWWWCLYLEINSHGTGWLYPAHSGDTRRNDSRLWRQGVLPCTCSRSVMQLAYLSGLYCRYKDAVDGRGILLPVHCYVFHRTNVKRLKCLAFCGLFLTLPCVHIVVASKCR